jgi:hypothetical protein
MGRPAQSAAILAMIGGRFGRLVCIGATRIGTGRKVICICDCGTEKTFQPAQVRTGKSQSCGCLRTDATVKALTKHGHSRAGHKTT